MKGGIDRSRRFREYCPVENMGKENLRAGPSAMSNIAAFEQELITIRDVESGCGSMLTCLLNEPIELAPGRDTVTSPLASPLAGSQGNQLGRKRSSSSK